MCNQYGIARTWKIATVCIAAITACCIAANQTWAASAWAYETGTGRVGKGVASTITKAKQKARTDCRNNGANPILIEDLSSSSTPGYGAIYTSFNNGWKLGASLGYAKKAKAKKRAKKFCKLSGGTDCQLVDTVHDPGKRAGGKSARRDFALSR